GCPTTCCYGPAVNCCPSGGCAVGGTCCNTCCPADSSAASQTTVQHRSVQLPGAPSVARAADRLEPTPARTVRKSPQPVQHVSVKPASSAREQVSTGWEPIR